MGLTLGVQQLLVGVLLVASPAAERRRLTIVDLVTLSRGVPAAILTGTIFSGVRDRRGTAGWLGWLAILYGAIACDWLDGPIARRRESSRMGAMLDIEADSWLTLCTACSGVAWGELSPTVVAAPLLRYATVFRGMRRVPYANLFVDDPRWVRTLGIVQMLLFIAALAPFGGRATRTIVGIVTPVQTPLQIGASVVVHWHRVKGR
ncbi:MAG TPA: CDP-alcohol phosphatidyltransferase family protein [Chloroflexota bacterium]|nr:CDP-alcohol phosphatidyltransferase family protein [Chloroflexota bacterium]